MAERRERCRLALSIAGVASIAAILLPLGCTFILNQVRGGREVSAFSHATHARGQGMRCLDCHAQPAGQKLPGFPGREDCAACHDPEASADPAAPFFDGVEPRWVHAGRQAEEIIFNHATHAAGWESACVRCHEAVASAPSIRSNVRMRMDQCTACHETDAPDRLDCAACHQRMRRDKAPDSHGEAWLARHGPVSRSTAAARRTWDRCDLCHAQGSCDHCHTTVRPKSHTNYFRGRGHGIASGIDRSQCSLCHQRDACDRCHSTTRPRSRTASFGTPSNRHCISCHMPVDLGESCGVCHLGTPSHEAANVMPADSQHQTTTPEQCRSCHFPLRHPDSGDNCRFCHR